MKRKGVTVYALGVGSRVDQAELEQIASGSQNVYNSTSFKDLKNIAGEIRHHFCRGIEEFLQIFLNMASIGK